MKIAAINLERSKDRRKLIESSLTRLGLAFEICPGIDASRDEHLRVSRYSEAAARRDYHRPLSPAEIGCFASHYLLWQRCVEAREPFVILEDDVLIDDGFVRALEISSELISSFSFVRLGLTHEAIDATRRLALPEGFELVSHIPLTLGTQCYMVSDVAAKVLLERAGAWSVPVDLYLNRIEMHGITSYGLRPYFVKHADQTAYPSEIGGDRYTDWSQVDRELKIRATVERFVAERGRRLL